MGTTTVNETLLLGFKPGLADYDIINVQSHIKIAFQNFLMPLYTLETANVICGTQLVGIITLLYASHFISKRAGGTTTYMANVSALSTQMYMRQKCNFRRWRQSLRHTTSWNGNEPSWNNIWVVMLVRKYGRGDMALVIINLENIGLMLSPHRPPEILVIIQVPCDGLGSLLTHWGGMTHICVSKFTIIGSDNGLSPGRRQAIIWTNVGILLNGPLEANFSEISSETHIFSSKKMHLNMSSGNWQPSCLGLNVLMREMS